MKQHLLLATCLASGVAGLIALLVIRGSLIGPILLVGAAAVGLRLVKQAVFASPTVLGVDLLGSIDADFRVCLQLHPFGGTNVLMVVDAPSRAAQAWISGEEASVVARNGYRRGATVEVAGVPRLCEDPRGTLIAAVSAASAFILAGRFAPSIPAVLAVLVALIVTGELLAKKTRIATRRIRHSVLKHNIVEGQYDDLSPFRIAIVPWWCPERAGRWMPLFNENNKTKVE